MIKENTIQIGPFPLGLDNVNLSNSVIFDQTENNQPRLVEAINVDIDNDGWPRSRYGISLDREGTNISGAWYVNGRFFVQEGSILLEKDGSTETQVASGLSDRISICTYADAIWFTDGTTHKVLRRTNLYNWGLSIPSITVSASSTTSSLTAGRYLVQCSFSDSYGNEGPTSILKAVTLTDSQSISVNCTLPTDASYLNIYASKRNQEEITFIAQVNQAALPYVFSTFPNEVDLPPAQNLKGPISNTNGIFSFRSWLMMWKDNVIFRSEALEPHLFYPKTNIYQFDGVINSVVPLLNGFWVGTENKLYWVADLPGLGSDQDTTGWVPFEKYLGKIYKGGRKINGSYISGLQTKEEVALFISDDGLLVGKSDGSYELLTYNRYKFTESNRYSIEYKEDSGINKLLIG